ncbi:MAG TPA: hypothetical protein VF605_12715 [Allosphingosinicella sp.]|jgi:hypothetical protein
MKHTQPRHDRENPAADTSGSRWVAPRLSRLSAGNAELGPTPLSDANGEFS